MAGHQVSLCAQFGVAPPRESIALRRAKEV